MYVCLYAHKKRHRTTMYVCTLDILILSQAQVTEGEEPKAREKMFNMKKSTGVSSENLNENWRSDPISACIDLMTDIELIPLVTL